MAELCELWELEVSIEETSAGVCTVAGTLWHRPSYPPLPGTHPGDPATGVVVETLGPLEAPDALGAVARMLEFLRPHVRPDDDGCLARLTLELPPALESLDWEALAAPTLVVRRWPASGDRTSHGDACTLSLPLQVDLVDRTGRPESIAEELYRRDGHLQMIRNSGIRFVERRQATGSAPIVHLVGPATDPEVARVLDRLGGSPELRLVVVQTGALGRQPLDTFRGSRTVVLEIDHSLDFAGLFYRKLLHDWPIDRSVAFALRHGAHGRCRLWGGGWERVPLLSAAVLESAERLAAKSTRLERSSWLETPFRGARTFRSPRGSRTPPVQPRSRAETLTDDLKARLDQMTQVREAKAAAAIAQVRQRAIDFRREDQGVRAVLEVQRQLDDAAAAASARASLDTAPAGAVETALGRVTSLWLRDGRNGLDLPKTEPVVKDRDYLLAVKVGRPAAEARAAAAFPEESLVETFRHFDELELNAVVFAPERDFDIPAPQAPLKLPRVGDSGTLNVALRALRAGACRLRVCIYLRTRLLQSVWLEVQVQADEPETPNARAPDDIRSELDYAATGDFALLDSLPEPEASIVVNDAPNGTHWLGVYAPNATAALSGLSARLLTIDDADVRTTVGEMQAQLTSVATLGKGYRFENAAPTPEEWKQRERMLVALARDGRRLCRTLLGPDLLRSVKKSISQPGVISIGRCRGDRVGIPWGLFYDYGLDPALSEATQSVCAVFAQQAREGGDRLDDPVACRAQQSCPLNLPGAEKTTVCPLGFWGARHQIELPLHHTSEADGDGAVKIRGAETLAHVPRVGPGRMRVACGRFDFDDDKHPDELAPWLDVEVRSTRDEILSLLKTGGFPIAYFFCHGRVVEKELLLQVGPKHPPQYIGPDSLDDVEWPRSRPLVFLNGCDTVAFHAEAINSLTTVFRACGAAGVVGTEFSVPRPLARAVGARVLARLAEGETLGRAFLDMRRALLRQMNPLGLAYTAYASAWLHYSGERDCSQCKAIGRA